MSLSKHKTVQTGTLGKAMDVLEVIAAAPKPLRFTELMQHIDQPRGTLHRQLTHLTEEGLVSQRCDGVYELGIRLLHLAAQSWSKNSLRVMAEPLLRGLQERTGETVHLVVLQGTTVVYLDTFEGRQGIRMHARIGQTAPVYCTGSGKALLSALPDDTLHDLIQQIDFHLYTEHTLKNAKALQQELQRIRQQGFAEDREEHELGTHCVAAPVVTQDGHLICGISIATPTFRLQTGQLEQWQTWVADTARQLAGRATAALGPKR